MSTGCARPAARCARCRSAARRRCASGRRRSSLSATRAAISSPRHSANSDGPEPDRLQPSAPASAAARLITARPGTSGARRGSAIVSSSERRQQSKSPVCRAWTNAPRFAHCFTASARRHGVAKQRARLRGLDLEIRMDHDGRQARRHRQRDDVGRIGAADQHEPAADGRRDVVGMRRAGAEASRLRARMR